MPKLQLDLQIETNSDLVPTKKKFKAWAKLALRVDTEFTIRIVDLEEGRMFNSTYRGKDYATNVLTFPLADEPHLMGDIVICAPIVEAEAKAQNKTVEAHYALLTVHGVLHLHGYDHENEEQAALMESIEVTTLQKLGYPNPYLITEDNHVDENHL